MYCMLGAGIARRVRCSYQAGRAARNGQVTLDRVANEKVQSNSRQMNHREDIQLEQFPVDLDVDVVPFGPLRPAGIVHQDVQRFEVVNYHVKVVVVVVHVQHVHLQDVDVVRSEGAIGLC